MAGASSVFRARLSHWVGSQKKELSCACSQSRAGPVEYAGLNPGNAEQPIVQHLFEDFEIAEKCCGRQRIAVQAGRVGIRLKRGDPVGQGRMRGVVGAVEVGQVRSSASRCGHRPGVDTRKRGRMRKG